MSALQSNPKPGDEQERLARAERLLHVASEWEPEREAPADLMARTLERMESRSPHGSLREWSRRSLAGWSVGTVGLAAAALGLVLIRPNVSTEMTAERALPPALSSYTFPKLSPRSSAYPSGMGTGNKRGPMIMRNRLPASVVSASFTVPGGTQGGTFTAVPNDPKTESLVDKAETIDIARNSSPLARRSVPKIRRGKISPNGSRPARFAGNITRRDRERLLHQVSSIASAKPAPVWQEEQVAVAAAPTEEYRVVMPVMFAETPGGSDNMTAVPALVELTYNTNPGRP